MQKRPLIVKAERRSKVVKVDPRVAKLITQSKSGHFRVAWWSDSRARATGLDSAKPSEVLGQGL